MSCVAKKKPTAGPPPDPHRGIPLGYRADSWRLVNALRAYAKSIRRSRNMAMTFLMERALAAEGFPVEKYPDEPPDE